MSDVRVIWQPHPGPQTAFLASPAREVLYGGQLGGGKTDGLIYGGVRQVDIPQYRALLLRQTFPQLREIIDRTHETFPEIGGVWREGKSRWEFPHSGATFEFGFCENWKDVIRYRGQQFQYIGYDEAGDCPEERIWLFLLSRLRRRGRMVRPMSRLTANPGGAGHAWLKRRFVSVCKPDGTLWYDQLGNSRAYIAAGIEDNPTLMADDPEYVQWLDSLPGTLYAQLRQGDWDAGEGFAFEALTDTSHLVTWKPEPYWTFFGAFDWGYGHKWSFGLFAAIQGTVVLVDSCGGRRDIPREIAEVVAAMLEQYGLYFSDLQYTVAGRDRKTDDEARGNFGPSIAEQFLAFGWPTINADQRRIAGYQNMLAYLDTKDRVCPRFVIRKTKSNVAGIEQLKGLVTDPDKPNDVKKVDVDPMTGEGGDDFYDMVRYGLMSRPIFAVMATSAMPHPDRNVRPVVSRPTRGWGQYAVPRPSGHPMSLARRNHVID